MSAFFTENKQYFKRVVKKAGKEMMFKILNSPFQLFAFAPRNSFLFNLKEKPVH